MGPAIGQAVAQSSQPSWVPLVVQIGLAITVIVLGTVAVMLVRRKFSQSQKGGDATAGASMMEQLRQMHREGKISDEELNAIRGKMRDSLRQQVGMAHAGLEKGPDAAVLAAKRAALEEQIRQQTGKVKNLTDKPGARGPMTGGIDAALGAAEKSTTKPAMKPLAKPTPKPTRPDIS
jgi:hypothetical protein